MSDTAAEDARRGGRLSALRARYRRGDILGQEVTGSRNRMEA
jgi:hypothetical protein